VSKGAKKSGNPQHAGVVQCYTGMAAQDMVVDMKAGNGQNPYHLHIENETDTDMYVYWINYEGEHEDNGTIPCHGWFDIDTWVSHPFAIKTDYELVALVGVKKEVLNNPTITFLIRSPTEVDYETYDDLEVGAQSEAAMSQACDNVSQPCDDYGS